MTLCVGNSVQKSRTPNGWSKCKHEFCVRACYQQAAEKLTTYFDKDSVNLQLWRSRVGAEIF
jgi:hypothetical protein